MLDKALKHSSQLAWSGKGTPDALVCMYKCYISNLVWHCLCFPIKTREESALIMANSDPASLSWPCHTAQLLRVVYQIWEGHCEEGSLWAGLRKLSSYEVHKVGSGISAWERSKAQQCPFCSHNGPGPGLTHNPTLSTFLSAMMAEFLLSFHSTTGWSSEGWVILSVDLQALVQPEQTGFQAKLQSDLSFLPEHSSLFPNGMMCSRHTWLHFLPFPY